jgi:hypothetical protein
MKAEIENLTNRLTYIPEPNSKELSPVTQSKRPEDDPDWPKEVKTMADILLRREIQLKIENAE